MADWDFSKQSAAGPVLVPVLHEPGKRWDYAAREPATVAAATAPEQTLRAYKPPAIDALERALMRSLLGIAVMVILGGTVGAIFTLIFTGELMASDQKDLAITVLAPVVGISGTVLGFYFARNFDGPGRPSA
jgi:hypothetical protein